MATQAPATLLCRAAHCAQLCHDGSGLCPYHLQREYEFEFKGLGVWELAPAAPLVAPAPPPPSAPLADLTPAPDFKEGDARRMVPSLTGLAPSADLLSYYDVEEQVYRYRTFKSTYTMPPWMRLLLTLLVHSGKITFGDLCLRCAVRRDHVADAYVDQGCGYKLVARRERGGGGSRLRHFMAFKDTSARLGAKRLVFIRDDVLQTMTNDIIYFAQQWVHMHPQHHVLMRGNVRTNGKPYKYARRVISGLTSRPSKELDEGQEKVAAGAAEALSPMSALTYDEVVELNEPPIRAQPRPSSPDLVTEMTELCLNFNLTVCTNLECRTCFPNEEPARFIDSPVPLFDPLDFLADECRDQVSELLAF